jgi:hypothetical protein
MGISTFPAASSGAVAKNYKEQIFNASGTWTYPSSSNFDGTVEVTCIGAGGAGGGYRNTNGVNVSGITGAGGGGRVILNQKLSVLNAGNQTVTVGAGGVSNCTTGFGSSSGRYSTFGAVQIANYYPDPNMRWGTFHNNTASVLQYPESRYSTTVSNNHSWVESRTIDSSLDTGYGAKNGGLGDGSAIGGVTNDGIYPYTAIFQVPASTVFKLMFYYTYMGASTTGTVTPQIQWFTSANVEIQTDSLATFTRTTSGTTFTQYTSSTITSPSTAAWARIIFNNGGGVGYNGLTLTPDSLGLTTPVSGNTSGYQWGGSAEGSVTVRTNTSNLSNFVIAQGGGGGSNLGLYTPSNGATALAGNAGLWGWTQGGFPTFTGSSTAYNSSTWVFGSSAGGAGGNATEPQLNMAYTSTSASTLMLQNGSWTDLGSLFGGWTQYIGTVRVMDSIAYYGGGLASYPVVYTTQGTDQYPFQYASSGGDGIQGYGAGGTSRFASGAAGTLGTSRGWNKGKGRKGGTGKFSTTGGTSLSKIEIAANTGNGGGGIGMSGESNTGVEGQNGSSGLVIVRWYE